MRSTEEIKDEMGQIDSFLFVGDYEDCKAKALLIIAEVLVDIRDSLKKEEVQLELDRLYLLQEANLNELKRSRLNKEK